MTGSYLVVPMFGPCYEMYVDIEKRHICPLNAAVLLWLCVAYKRSLATPQFTHVVKVVFMDVTTHDIKARLPVSYMPSQTDKYDDDARTQHDIIMWVPIRTYIYASSVVGRRKRKLQ